MISTRKSAKYVALLAGSALVLAACATSEEPDGEATVGGGELKSVSGTVEVGSSAAERLGVRTVSGRVKVSVPPDATPRLHLKSMSGRIRCDCPEGSGCDIDVATVSGSIEVRCR